MAEFSLAVKPFIPCTFHDGTPAELNLRDVLVRSHDLTEIRDGSPLVTVALYRLLLAILHHAYRGPKNRTTRIEIIRTRQFAPQIIDDYFAKYSDKFDLFHAKYPFYQTANFRTKEPSGINRLAQELARGNNPALFDHTTDDPPSAFTPAQAARVVIADQAFAVGGGKSDTGNATHAPLVAGAIVLARGDTLFETLCLNLTTFDGCTQPIVGKSNDAPVWERSPKRPDQCSGLPDGYLDYLTWQARTLCLHPEDEDGRTVVRHVWYAQGRKFVPPEHFFDPMSAYRKDKQEGYARLRFNEFRELWRDSFALFQFADTDEQFKGPTTLETLKQLPEDVVPRKKRYRISSYGLAMDPQQAAKTLFWRHEALPLRLEYLASPLLVDSLKHALVLAESVARDAIRPAVKDAVKSWLKADSGNDPDPGRVSSLVKSFGAEPKFWSRLERPFRSFLIELADDVNSRDEHVCDWFCDVLRPAAKEAYAETIGRIDGGRDLRAFVAGEKRLDKGLDEIASQLPAPISQGASS